MVNTNWTLTSYKGLKLEQISNVGIVAAKFTKKRYCRYLPLKISLSIVRV